MNLLTNIKILYGNDGKWINVKDKFLDNFLYNDNLIYIPYQTNFNSYFGDHIFGKVKTIKILNNNELIKEISENSVKVKCYRFNIFSGQQPKWQKDDILALINFYDYDVSWAKKLNFPYIIYYKEQFEELPFSAKNKAKSETNLLKFIIDFYDNLPKYIINLHQYNVKSYWNGDIRNFIANKEEIINKLDSSHIKGFLPIIPFKLGHIKEQIPRMKKSGWWDNTMEKYFGDIKRYGNYTLNRDGIATFIVARENILSLPKEFYSNMYNWLCKNSIGTTSQGNIVNGNTRMSTSLDYNPNSHFFTSRYMEWSWEFIFTRKYLLDYYKILKDIFSNKILYGNNIKIINIEEIFKKKFIKNNKIIIPKGIDFNHHFGNPVPKSLKYIVYISKNSYHIISETDNYYQDLIIDI